MKKGLKAIIFVFLLFAYLINIISAGVYFTNIQPIYNLGDMIDADITVSPEGEGPLKLTLTCDNTTLEVYKGAPPEKIQLPLTSLWMNGMTGECYFTGDYLNEKKESVRFRISKKLELTVLTNSIYSKAGGTITISGNARKLNNEPINGEVEISMPQITADKLYGPVNNGEFSVSYTLAKDISSGDYRIDIIAYEKTLNEKTSEGMEILNLNVFQSASSLDIALDNPRIDPGNIISFKPILSDQSGKTMDSEVSIIINDPNKNRIYEKLGRTSETQEYKTKTNMSSGYYTIEISTGDLIKIKDFYINEKALVNFEIRNDTLIVTNTGNIIYNKSIQIDISGKSFIRKIDNLAPGESKEFFLSGVDGLYDISVKDDSSELSENSIPLTGNAIAVSDVKKGFSAIANTPIIWIILLIVLGAVILFLFRDILKKRSVAYPTERKIFNIENKGSRVITIDAPRPERNEKIKSSLVPKIEREIGDKKLSPIIKKQSVNPYGPYNPPKDKKNDSASFLKNTQESQHIKEFQDSRHQQNKEKQEATNFSIANAARYSVPEKQAVSNRLVPPVVLIQGEKREKYPSVAEQSLVMDGHKSRASIIALKIKNEISKFAKENLEKALVHAYNKKGAVYESGNYTFIIFSPLITKTFKNEIEAIKASESIVSALNEHNKKFNDKIIFGIGINTGDIINKVENKKLKFTSLGGLTVAAKKLADNSNDGIILMTKEVYEKTMAEVKAEKKEIQGLAAYELKKVADYDKNKKFINDFLKRENNIKNNNFARQSVMPQKDSASNTSEYNPLAGL